MDAVPPGDQARLWLYGVARNVLANHRREVVRRHDLSTALAVEIADLYQPSAEESAEFSTIGQVLGGLPDNDREPARPEQAAEVLSLVAWEGLDPASSDSRRLPRYSSSRCAPPDS
jgi:RNA polymerase sigma-70 factor (ECF subfamily)